jgi:hypothetical protein
MITLLVGQHIEAGAQPPSAPEHPGPASIDAHRPAEVVRPAHPTAPVETLDGAADAPDIRPRPTPVSAAPIPHAAEQRTSAFVHDFPIDPQEEQTLHLAPHQERKDRLKSTRRRHPRRRLLASASLCLGMALTAGLIGLRAVDGPAGRTQLPAPRPRSASPRRLEADPVAPSHAPTVRRAPRRSAPLRTTHDRAAAAPVVAQPHRLASAREPAPIPSEVSARPAPASPQPRTPRISADPVPTPPTLPPSPAGQLPGPPPT